jgi:hypothetical protein
MADNFNHIEKASTTPPAEHPYASFVSSGVLTKLEAKACSQGAISGAQSAVDKHFGSCEITDSGNGRTAVFSVGGRPQEATSYNKETGVVASGKIDGSDDSITVVTPREYGKDVTVQPGAEDKQKGLGETTRKADGHIVVKGPNGEELTISPDGFSKLDKHDGKPPILNPFGGKMLTHEQMDKIAHSKMLGVSKDAHGHYELKIPGDK